MPILCAQQCQFLEGVGDTVAHKFVQMIQDREKEYEDGLFFGGLALDQKKKRQRKQANMIKKLQTEKGEKDEDGEFDDDYRFDDGEMLANNEDHDNILSNFAGININAGKQAMIDDGQKPDVLNMSLK